jgi:hypothetical protein
MSAIVASTDQMATLAGVTCLSSAMRHRFDLATDRERTTQGKMKRILLMAMTCHDAAARRVMSN